MSAVMWFRRDLRVDDHPALARAAELGDGDVVGLFVLDPVLLARSSPNRRRFLSGALRALDTDLGGGLAVRYGDPAAVVTAVAAEVGADVVVATADFAPYGTGRDATVRRSLEAEGRRLETVGSNYAVAPGTLGPAVDRGYAVFGAFHRAWLRNGWLPPVPAPGVRPRVLGSGRDTVDAGAREAALAADGDAAPDAGASAALAGLPPWWGALPLGPARHLPPAGAAHARTRLARFVRQGLEHYAQDRDRPDLDGTSMLSPYLRFGCIHPRTVLSALGTGAGAERMAAELCWREFFADVLWRRPDSARRPLQAFGARLDWDDGPTARRRFGAWATGRTGYALVDAGMRQLLAEGWMHNRARMVTASFLVKDLHIDWRLGARWFMWHLVDGDLASNQHGWQWVAGTGADAAPFHRIFNPALQRERFDPDSRYVERHLGRPGMPPGGTPALFAGREAVALPEEGSPDPIVDHAVERRDALARFERARRAGPVPNAPPTGRRRR